MVYVCNQVHGLYLSQSVLKNLKLIPNDFPNHHCEISALNTNGDSQQEGTAACGCPTRSPCPELPSSLPYPATPEYRAELEDWIKRIFANSAFNTCEHQQLQTMTGDPLEISFLADTDPVAVHKPIPVPHHWKEAVKSQLDADVALGIIEPVPTGTPTTWCSRMVTVPKKNGSPRRTVDLQNLNAATRRETHHTQSPFHIVNVVPRGKTKTVLDAWNGYHSVPLSPEARNATTFITEWGRYRYLRAPQGFHASNDGYTKRFDDITQDFPRVARCVDDSILWDDDIATSFWHTLQYIKLCGDNGIVFNPTKFKFAEVELEFAGFDVTRDGYKPTSKLLDAIEQFPTPTNLTGIRSWFGLVNQASYAFTQAPTMAPFRELLKHNSKFYWDDTLDQLFAASKKEILSKIKAGVRTFETGKQTCLSTDWSKSGLGFTLTQKHCSCSIIDPSCGPDHWKLVYAGSRFTTNAEQRYAPIEGEALALLFGLDSCRMFIMGCPNLTVAVDHKPLIRIFNNRDLADIKNPRLLKIKEKSLMYRFNIISIPGRENCGADAMSRIPTSQTANAKVMHIEESITAATQIQFDYENNTQTVNIDRIRKASSGDHQYIALINQIESGFPQHKSELSDDIKVFWSLRNELYTIGGLVYVEGRLLIPQQLRSILVDQLHIGHQGTNSMRANAKQRFFWPGMGSQLSLRRAQCKRCNEIAPSNPKEMPTQPLQPTYPFQMVVADLFHMAGRIYVVYADRFSGWTEVASTKSSSNSKTICDIFRRYFISFGVPEELASDGGPPFQSSEFSNFLRIWNITHRCSSAYYPQSNGRAEAAVKYMKRILTTNISIDGSLDKDPVAKALLLHRNTPSHDIGASPAELLFGRPIRDHLPNPVSFRGEWIDLADQREVAMKKRYAMQLQSVSPRKTLNELKVGDAVAVQNQHGNHPLRWNNTGTIVETLPNRKYRVLVDGSRRTTFRNRRFLKEILPNTKNTVTQESLPVAIHNEEIDQTRNLSLEGEPALDTALDSAPPTEATPTAETPAAIPSLPPPPQVLPSQQSDNAPLRRSTRTRRRPLKLNDYI